MPEFTGRPEWNRTGATSFILAINLRALLRGDFSYWFEAMAFAAAVFIVLRFF